MLNGYVGLKLLFITCDKFERFYLMDVRGACANWAFWAGTSGCKLIVCFRCKNDNPSFLYVADMTQNISKLVLIK
jgi:hypothetical protein